MSGHSKWSKIKHTKGEKDRQKSNIFSKLSHLITLAVLEGGGITDPGNNVKLRLVIEKAKSQNLPKENIQRAIEKGVGPGKQNLREIVYEAFGSGGVALLISATTDNSNRTLSEIRNILDLSGGKLGIQGSVSYLFRKCGVIQLSLAENSEESILAFAEKIDAFDLDKDVSFYYVFIDYTKLNNLKELSEVKIYSTDLIYRPNAALEISDKNTAEKSLKLIRSLEELDDIQKVYTNAKII